MAQNTIRKSLERLFLKSIRLYTFNTPFQKGKYRLYQTALELCRFAPKEIKTKTHDGREYIIDLTGGMHESVYFLGQYEPFVTEVISAVVKSGDVCLDVGANFGWFTTLLHLLGAGEIHAFEPMPDVFANLRQNLALAGEPENVYLNNLALGDEAETVNLYRFADLPNGFSSLSNTVKSEFETFSVPMLPLDSYLTEKKVDDVDFVKLDVEGAELMFLRGATKLFRQKTPPILIIEMALGTTKNFDYLPNDLIEFIRAQADYNFLALDEYNSALYKIEGFAPEEIGANVLCVPAGCDSSRLKGLKIIE